MGPVRSLKGWGREGGYENKRKLLIISHKSKVWERTNQLLKERGEKPYVFYCTYIVSLFINFAGVNSVFFLKVSYSFDIFDKKMVKILKSSFNTIYTRYYTPHVGVFGPYSLPLLPIIR